MRATLLLKWSVGIALAPVVASGATLGNVLQNAGFEDGGIAPWYNFSFSGQPLPPETLWEVTTDEAHMGAYSAAALGSAALFVQEFDPIHKSLLTEMGLWVKQSEPHMMFAGVWFTDHLATLVSITPPSTDWYYVDLLSFSGIWDHPPGFQEEACAINVMGTYETLTYVDDLVVVPEPHALTLLATVGLFARRRR